MQTCSQHHPLPPSSEGLPLPKICAGQGKGSWDGKASDTHCLGSGTCWAQCLGGSYSSSLNFQSCEALHVVPVSGHFPLCPGYLCPGCMYADLDGQI